jgi:hypothetical protein
MAKRNFPTICSVCEWVGHYVEDLPGQQFPTKASATCPNHGGPGLEMLDTEVNPIGLETVRSR